MWLNYPPLLNSMLYFTSHYLLTLLLALKILKIFIKIFISLFKNIFTQGLFSKFPRMTRLFFHKSFLPQGLISTRSFYFIIQKYFYTRPFFQISKNDKAFFPQVLFTTRPYFHKVFFPQGLFSRIRYISRNFTLSLILSVFYYIFYFILFRLFYIS